jgi:hypothetical protein
MRKNFAVFVVIVLLVAATGFSLLKAQVLYTDHEAVVNVTIADVLERNDRQLPKQSVDLAMLNDASQEVALFEVTHWQVEEIELENIVPLRQALLDDDPIYRLKANLQITYADGSQTTLAWESWRYGIVFGSIVLSLGDGPPGQGIAATIQ